MDRKELIELLEKNTQAGKVTFENIEGLVSASLDEFIKQPADSMLYDLNRDMATCVTFIDKPTWINNFACCVVIKALKKRIEELENELNHEQDAQAPGNL